MYIVRTTVID